LAGTRLVGGGGSIPRTHRIGNEFPVISLFSADESVPGVEQGPMAATGWTTPGSADKSGGNPFSL
jgi:hypothetical protein